MKRRYRWSAGDWAAYLLLWAMFGVGTVIFIQLATR